ncbi:hypothetical protein CC80DRAFT_549001 [Byssothecium circinans]|uniref:Uncharacterized protein n=1 Tax=Byssothecium circinans TaxID=147558 RepID=A0A6A5TTG2_9PLEO|nr:hypothetical protein CC80DRAFT_549001 [Byssothecium circinans]
MTLAAVKARLDPSLLKLLPSANSMEWVHYPNASPPKALVIGHQSEEPILVSIAIMTGQQRMPLLQFAIGDKRLTQESVIRKDLVEPFKWLNTPMLAPKQTRILSLFIKFYFYEAKVVRSGLGGDGDYMGKMMKRGLLQIQRAKESTSGRRQGSERSTVDETDEEENESEEEERHEPVLRPRSFRVKSADHEKLVKILADNNELHYLDNIPTISEMQFSTQTNALFVGKRDGHDIHAFFRHTGNNAEIRFFFQGTKGRTHSLPTESFASQRILHPFNKTYKKDATSINKQEEARLTVLVTWYFIAAGVAKNVLAEIEDYPDQFRDMLAYVSQRMGPAASKPKHVGRLRDGLVDEEGIQSTLRERPVSKDDSEATTRSLHQSFKDPSPPRASASRKRTAEQAQFDDIEETIHEDRNLTKQLNELDDELDAIELRRQALTKQKAKFLEQRKDVRKRLKRQSLALVSDNEE